MKFRKLDIDPSKISESITVKPQILAESGTAFKEAKTENGTRYLLPRIEAIHAGTTRNNVRYPAEKLRGSEELKSGVYSWLNPFPKPVIFNHDVNTEATGRIQAATFAEFTQAGRPGIVVVPKITQEKAIEDILGGRLLTVSIGATTDAAICSVCGTNIIEEGFCGHWKGEEYDGVKAEWITGNVWFDELSWVNVPADQDAMIVGGAEEISTAEAFAVNGKEIINLGKKTTEWLVDPTDVLSESLTTKEEKGDSTLTEEQIQAMQAELEEVKEAKAALETELNTVKEEKEAIEAELATTKEAVEAKETELEEKATELTSVKEELEAKKTEVEELTSTKEALETEKTELETSLEEEKVARQEVLEENAKLTTEAHKSLAERVVDLRISLGKESSREEALENYVSRTTESLNDSLQDLLKEKPATRQQEQVENPASDNDLKGPNGKVQEKELTAEEVLANLFRGPAFKK